MKVIAINSGQKGYSKLKKFDVIVFILNQSPLPKDSVRRKSVKQLKKIEKNRGIKNKYWGKILFLSSGKKRQRYRHTSDNKNRNSTWPWSYWENIIKTYSTGSRCNNTVTNKNGQKQRALKYLEQLINQNIFLKILPNRLWQLESN